MTKTAIKIVNENVGDCPRIYQVIEDINANPINTGTKYEAFHLV
jgi:hypothetical protein